MNNTRHNKLNYKLFLFRFRESNYYPFFLYGGIIFLCLLLVVFVMIPLTKNLFSVDVPVTDSRGRIDVLTKNINYLSALSNTDISRDMQFAEALFPESKDFNGAIQAINAAALDANTTIDNLSFNNVGDIGGNASTSENQNNTLQVLVTVQGSSSNIAQFLQSLEDKVPLMNVEDVTVEQGTATFTIQVAYQPYKEETIDLAHTALSFSPQTLSLLQQAAQWQSSSNSNPPSLSTGTASGNLPTF